MFHIASSLSCQHFMYYISCHIPADSLHASYSMHGSRQLFHISCQLSYLMYYANRLKYFANCSIIRLAVSSITPAVSLIMSAVSFSVTAVPCFACQPYQSSNTPIVTLDIITWILPNVLFRKIIYFLKFCSLTWTTDKAVCDALNWIDDLITVRGIILLLWRYLYKICRMW
jgi:hypothetical protein